MSEGGSAKIANPQNCLIDHAMYMCLNINIDKSKKFIRSSVYHA